MFGCRAALLGGAAVLALACDRTAAREDEAARTSDDDVFTAVVGVEATFDSTPGLSSRVQWALSPDSCEMLVIERPWGVERDPLPAQFIFASERQGLWHGDPVWDVEPSPDWHRLALSLAFRARPARDGASSDSVWSEVADRAHTDSATIAAHSFPVSGMSEARGYALPLIEDTDDQCYGDDCELDLPELLWGGWRVRWTADGTRAAFGSAPSRADVDAPSERWTLVDADSGAIVGETRDTSRFAPRHWVDGPALDAVDAGDRARTLRTGRLSVESRGGTITLRESGVPGVARTRRVGSGVALAATRNAEYIAALVPGARGAPRRPVIYAFSVSHVLERTSCDR